MRDEPDLNGRRILVVEDEYFLAADAEWALRDAGAEVAGPCSSEAAAQAEFEARRPDTALVDINLGSGPSFRFAGTLKERRVPFVFVTGYDAVTIPNGFESVPRLQKPLELRQILGAFSKLLTNADWAQAAADAAGS